LIAQPLMVIRRGLSRVATRYDKLDLHYLAFVQLAPIGAWLRSLGDPTRVGPARDNQRDPLPAQAVEQPRGRVRVVGDHRRRVPARPATPAGAQGAPLEQRAEADQVVTLPASQVDRHGRRFYTCQTQGVGSYSGQAFQPPRQWRGGYSDA
jgi:hypothetical protein